MPRKGIVEAKVNEMDRLYAVMKIENGQKRGIAVMKHLAPDFIVSVSPETVLEQFGVKTPTKQQYEFAEYLSKCCNSASEAFEAAITPDYDIASGLVARFAADNRVSDRRYVLSLYAYVEDLMNVKHGKTGKA